MTDREIISHQGGHVAIMKLLDIVELLQIRIEALERAMGEQLPPAKPVDGEQREF